MPKPTSRRATHPKGELEPTLGAPVEDTKLDTFGGRVDVLWDPKAEVTALGPLVYFIQFLKTSGLWERWVEECPLTYTSNNAPPKAGILGGILVTLLSGHKRYAHINALRHDPVIPPMLGLDEFPCEDSVRRAFQRGDHERYTLWMDQSLNRTFEPLLTEPWVLDIDATVKTLYGRQEEAKVGYN
ncbi:MAG: transposase, partial [Acidobacteriota bacterium]